jgi:two-component system, cell cycle sensor histidine kinase and response regulator CckA
MKKPAQSPKKRASRPQGRTREQGAERYRLLFNSATDAVFVHKFAADGMPGRFIEVNEAACRRYGYTREELLRMRPLDIDAPEGLAAIPDAMRKVAAEGRATWEGLHITKDGRKIPVEITNVLFDLLGEPTILATARDITERKQAGEQMRRSGEQLRFQALLLDQIGDTVTATDLDGRITFVNEAQCRAVNRPREELLGTPVHIYGNDPARGATQQQIIEATRAKGGWRGEVINFDRDGREFIVDCRTTLIRDDAGRPIGMCGVGTDISERQRLEQELARQAARLQAIFETEPECVKIVAPDGTLLEMNPAGLEMIEAESLDQVQQRPLLAFVSPEYQAAFSKLHERVIRGAAGKLEFEAIGMKGGRRWLETHAVPLRDPASGTTNLLGVTRDITSRRQAEEALQQAHQREMLHFNQTPLGVIEWNLDFCVTRWNPAAEQVFGYSAAEAFGQHAAFIVPEAVRPHVTTIWQRLLNLQGGGRSTNENLHKDGRRILCEWYNTPLADEQGRVVGVASLVMDVTDRRQAEEQLRNSEQLYHSLVENLPQGIFRKDLTGRFTFANRKFCQSLGRQLSEILGRCEADFCPPDLAAKYRLDDQYVIATGQSIETEKEYQTESRERRSAWVVKTPLCGAQGQVIGVQGIFWDITEQKRAKEALAEREERYRSLFDLSPAGILLEDAEGNILEANPAMCRIFGYAREELCGRNVRMLAHPELHAEVDQHIANLLAGKTLLHEIDNVGKDGQLRRVELHEMSVTLPDGRRGILAIVNNITERRQLEEQLRHLQRMESIGQLAAGVAHDFNNILTVINGSSEILTELLAGKPELLEWVTQIATAGEKAAALTRQLLLFSRKQHMQPRPVNLNELTSNLTKMLGCVLGEDITLEFSYENELPLVQGDPGMLEQVIMNLAVNARDAMPRGGRLHIATSTVNCASSPAAPNMEGKPGEFVRLVVRDTGCGIPPEIRDRIFEPFFSTKEVGKGTGLGLATVFGIITQHGGWIDVESKEGQGTAFLIHLPAGPGSKTDASGRAHRRSEPGRGETVLVVEDEISVRDLVCHTLARHGYKIIMANSGAEVHEFAHSQLQEVDLLVTDLMMPGGINGRELAQSLRRRFPGLRVIYCSGYSPEIGGGRLALENGISFIQKPFTPRDLLHAVADCLRA